jgi:hypothetical protein
LGALRLDSRPFGDHDGFSFMRELLPEFFCDERHIRMKKFKGGSENIL